MKKKYYIKANQTTANAELISFMNKVIPEIKKNLDDLYSSVRGVSVHVSTDRYRDPNNGILIAISHDTHIKSNVDDVEQAVANAIDMYDIAYSWEWSRLDSYGTNWLHIEFNVMPKEIEIPVKKYLNSEYNSHLVWADSKSTVKYMVSVDGKYLGYFAGVNKTFDDSMFYVNVFTEDGNYDSIPVSGDAILQLTSMDL
jgi:hypothetical protein